MEYRFSQKQREYLDNANKRWNFKSGATRSGKSYIDYWVIPARIRARKGLEGLVFILGVTQTSIERNILEPMRQIFGEDLVGEIKSNNKCMLFGEQVYCLGAEKVSQVSKIRGASIKYCYGDEVADWNEEVFELLKSRLDKEYSCFDGALNPQSPNHWLKEFLDDESLDIYVQKYTIFDNPFLPKEFVDNLCKEYEGSVYYKRYILGEWALAEGLVYPMFRKDRNVIDGDIQLNPRWKFFCAVDYGTVNAFAVNVYAFDGRNSIQIREGHYDGRKMPRVDNEEYYKLLDSTIGGLPIEMVIVDPSASGFIQTILKYGKYMVSGAINDVLNGIQEVTKYINYGLIKVHDSCIETIKEFQAYAWDDKHTDDNGKEIVLKVNDHHMDALRYYIMYISRTYNLMVV